LVEVVPAVEDKKGDEEEDDKWGQLFYVFYERV
jgi:hypothetical protein